MPDIYDRERDLEGHRWSVNVEGWFDTLEQAQAAGSALEDLINKLNGEFAETIIEPL